MKKSLLGIIALTALMMSCGKNMQTTESGIEYRIIQTSDSAKQVRKGDVLMINMLGKAKLADSLGGGDTTFFNSYITEKPYYIPADEPTLKDIFLLLRKGDSAEFNVNADTLFMKSFGQLTPAMIKKSSNIHFTIKVLDAYSQEELQRQKEDQQKEMMVKDSLAMLDFIKTMPELKSTPSGLRYQIIKSGKGKQAKKQDKATVNYKGYLLNGTVFDESKDKPFQFTVGLGQVIPGWDEGVALMKEGDVFKFIIPWKIAYGQRGAGPIPPCSTLVFEVELLKLN